MDEGSCLLPKMVIGSETQERNLHQRERRIEGERYKRRMEG